MTGSIQPYPPFGASCKGGIEKDGIEINRMAPQPPLKSGFFACRADKLREKESDRLTLRARHCI